MNTVVLRKAVNLGELFGVVDEVLNPFAILTGKVFCHTLETLINTFTNSNTGHYDDELRPTVASVQFVHGFDVGVCLTGTGFHFDGKGQVFTLQMFDGFQALCHLNGAYIFAEAFPAQYQWSVAKAFHFIESSVLALVHKEIAQPIAFELSLKYIRHALGRFCLKALVLIFNLHCVLLPYPYFLYVL